MTDQEQKKVDLNKATEDFGNAKQERERAREKLRNSEQELERVRHDLKELHTQKRLLENARDKTARASEKLAARMEKAEAGLARARAQQKSTDTAEQALPELQTRQGQLQAEQARNEEQLENLTGKIQEKQREEKNKESEVEDNRGHLTSAKQEVIKTAADLNGAAAVEPFNQIRSFLWKSLKELNVSGSTGGGYLGSVLLGVIFEHSFYSDSGIDFFYYFQPEDFFFSNHKLIMILAVLLILLWGIQWSLSVSLHNLDKIKLPYITEAVAFRCSGIINCWPIKSTFVLIALLTSVIGSVWAGGYYYERQQLHEETVFVTIRYSSEQSQKFTLVGSNGTYTFLRPTGEDGNDTTVRPIPKSEILLLSPVDCKVTDTCPVPPENRTRAILDREDNPWIEELVFALSLEDHVTERNARAFIRKEMDCTADDGRFDMSEFIRFDLGKDTLKVAAEEQIATFMNRPGRINRMKIFGFTSPDGDGGHNDSLSVDRAKVVKDEVESKYKGYLPAGTYDVPTNPIGENHSINGIANSRSVVIAACRSEPDKAEKFLQGHES